MSSKLQPALLAGLTIGILSGLPFVNMVNVCCCLWVVGGGVLAAYLLQQNQPLPISYGDGALVGLLAGILGFLVSSLVGMFVSLLPPPIGGPFHERLSEMMREMPPDAREIIEQVGVGALSVFFAFIGFCVTAVMAAVGGLIGTAIFQSKLPPGGTQEGQLVVLPPGIPQTPGEPPTSPPPPIPPAPPAPNA
ncbi:MAG: hypothetical protein GEV06_09845 [Luteitalea sp.]|nr:hypothetical protein [Luteitalea sp.]